MIRPTQPALAASATSQQKRYLYHGRSQVGPCPSRCPKACPAQCPSAGRSMLRSIQLLCLCPVSTCAVARSLHSLPYSTNRCTASQACPYPPEQRNHHYQPSSLPHSQRRPPKGRYHCPRPQIRECNSQTECKHAQDYDKDHQFPYCCHHPNPTLE